MSFCTSEALQRTPTAELTTASLPATQGDPFLTHRLAVASKLFDTWTKNGSEEAALAERFLDGSIDALEGFIALNECGSSMRPAGTSEVDLRSVDELMPEAFAAEYMLPNKPVLLRGTSRDWAAMRDWVTKDGSIDMHCLVERFGDSKICATEIPSCATTASGRIDMTLREFADYWARHHEGCDGRVLYLKDWHFASEHPSYKAYVCPSHFSNDWLNDYHESKRLHASTESTIPRHDVATSDYRFVYLGPKGSWTPAHTDVLRSHSWSINVCGRKRWRLLAPAHSQLLMDRFGRETAPRFDLGQTDAAAAARFPNLALAARHAIEIEQGVGEALFVPSGWHHTVENLEDTLSINHNWINGSNVHWTLEHVFQERRSAVAAIEDCRVMTTPAEFEALVQRNMAANCGLDFPGLAGLLGTAAAGRLRSLHAAPARSVSPLDALDLRRCGLALSALAGELEAMLRGPECAQPCGIHEAGAGAGGDCTAVEECEACMRLLTKLDSVEGLAPIVRRIANACERGLNVSITKLESQP